MKVTKAVPAIFFFSVFFLSLTIISISEARVPADSIVGIWLFDEDGAEVAKDRSDNGLDGVIEGDPDWDDGVFGKALEFDGTSVRVVVPSIGKMEMERGSMVLWVMPDFELDDNVTYGQIGIGGYYGDGLGEKDEKCHQIFKWGGNNNWFFRVGFDDPNNGVGANQFATGADLMPNGEWTHAAMTWEKDGDSLVYINGEKAGTLSTATLTLTEWKQEKIFIGTSWNNEKHKGLIDEVGVFTEALSQDEIKDIMNRGLDGALNLTAVSSAGKLITTWASTKVQY